MAAAAARTGATIGKKELADRLGWSRPKLDRRLTEDKNFPVESRGDQSGGWRFDLAKVKAHLGGTRPALPESPAKKPPAIDQAQLRDSVAPPRMPPLPAAAPRRSAHHVGEASARQRKDEADASLKENKLRLENAELVPRAELRQTLAQMMIGFGHGLDTMPEKLAKLCGLPEDAVPGIRTIVDDIRREMVANAASVLSDAN
jgi:hypothetical protein